jgi:hypothetical protein
MLKGKTLLVYWYLLQRPTHSVGIREVQRALGFSSPSVAAHHLDKLENLTVIKKKLTGEYVLETEIKVGVLQFFTRMGRYLLPRYLFYSVFITTMFTLYSALCILGFLVVSIYAVIFALVALIILWYETFRLWKAKPF